jgi:hypothetical protein
MSTGHLQMSPPVPARDYRDLRRWVHHYLSQHPVAEVDPDDVALELIGLTRSSIRHGAGLVTIELADHAGLLVATVVDGEDEQARWASWPC